ncbi:MAG: biotin--[acetyl-CoA-carboxylase] ligase [Planctomycetota bacterium]|jgi:BirA family biotin operon repressor/biotin-[acetyl-CoA-carboxylase] ligase
MSNLSAKQTMRANCADKPTNNADQPDRLIPEEIMSGLKTKVVGSEVRSYEQTTSTMDVAKTLTGKDFKNGLVVFTELQTRGKGRSVKSWHCPKYKGLLFTLLLKHKMPSDQLCLLVGAVSVAITEAIRETLLLPAEIKWPNDVLIGGKKVGGVLVEIEKISKTETVFLIGVGINVNLSEEELPQQVRLPATSLSIEKNGHINRTALARTLLQYIDKWYLILKDSHYRYITECWKEFCVTVGEMVTISDGSKEYVGRVIDISHNGGLMLRLESGEIKILRGEHATIKG